MAICIFCKKEFKPNRYFKTACSDYCRYHKKCELCGNVFKVNRVGSSKVYCDDCKSNRNDEIKLITLNKVKQTSLERYGVDNPNKSSIVREKIEKTCLEKYGAKTNLMTDDTKEKIKKTCLERYGTECFSSSEQFKKKYEENSFKKYGVKNPTCLPEVQEKMKKTCLERYGVENASKSPEIREKFKQTCLGRYGVDHYCKSDVVKEKIKKTNLDKYGYSTPFLFDDFQEKVKQTCLVKHGVEFTGQIESAKKKRKQTCLKKYGKENYSQTEEFQKKIKQTCIEKYGVDHPNKTGEFKEKLRNTYRKKLGLNNYTQKHFTNYNNFNKDFVLSNFVKNGFLDSYSFCDYFNCSFHSFYRFIKDNEITVPVKSSHNEHIQRDIVSFIQSFYTDVIYSNHRKLIYPLEVDIYLEDLNIGIEFDGLLYHSYGISSFSATNNAHEETDSYHLNKTQLCEEKGIKLFHIFENEWKDNNKQEIWRSVIKNSLGYSDRKIFGRKCSIRQINQDELFSFLIENHLQGPALSSINYGLYYNDELVSVMTFGKSRFNKNYDWELIRFCNKINTNVIGSFSKLLKHFKKHNTGTIISYGNRRWVSSLNNVYSKNGGKLIKISKPNYYYFTLKHKAIKLESRIKYQKHKLKNILENFDESLSETENMYNNGFRKVYDCGNLVYEL